jgi:peptidoglycan/xylan/chitin deacetylase (PgdA/CDA1 family)
MTVALCFHHVSPEGGRFSNPPQRLHAHLTMLKRAGYTFIGFDEFVADAAAGRLGRRDTVLVTTDDGYVDNWYWAFPVLRDLGVPAVFFVITGNLLDGESRQAPGSVADIRALSDDDNPERFLNWSELAAMQSSGLVSVQSHTHTHLDLRGFSDRGAMLEALRSDLNVASDLLGSRLGTRPSALAWPWGYSTTLARREARAAGLHFQFSVVPGRIGNWLPSGRFCRMGADDIEPGALLRHVQWVSAPGLGTLYTLARIGYNAARQRMAAMR